MRYAIQLSSPLNSQLTLCIYATKKEVGAPKLSLSRAREILGTSLLAGCAHSGNVLSRIIHTTLCKISELYSLHALLLNSACL